MHTKTIFVYTPGIRTTYLLETRRTQTIPRMYMHAYAVSNRCECFSFHHDLNRIFESFLFPSSLQHRSDSIRYNNDRTDATFDQTFLIAELRTGDDLYHTRFNVCVKYYRTIFLFHNNLSPSKILSNCYK